MLISAHIHKFRSCENVEINDFGDITAFIGRNGAGKTNILKAIELAAHFLSSINTRSVFLFEEEISLRFKFSEKIYKYIVSTSFDVNTEIENIHEKIIEEDEFGDHVLFSNTNGNLIIGKDKLLIKIGASTPAAQSIISLLPNHLISASIKEICEFSKSIKYYNFSEFSKFDESLISVVFAKDYAQWLSLKDNQDDTNQTTLFKIIYLWKEKKDIFIELLELLGSNGIGLLNNIEIEETIYRKKVSSYFLHFNPHGINDTVSFSDLSFGTRRIFRLILAIIYDKASVALIEQPEDGIHPGLLHKIIPLLRSYANPNQFIIASHSPDVLNRLKPEEIRMVDMKDGKTRVRALGEKEIEIANDFIKNEGALSDFIESIEEL